MHQGLIKQIEDSKPTYSKITTKMLENLIEDIMFKKEQPIKMWTGIGGVIEYINVALEQGQPIGFILAHITRVDSRGTGLYEIGSIKTKPMKEKALFLDLDGTIIITKSGERHPKTIDDWKFIEGVLERIKMYRVAGYHICIVTNEGGIELGYITMEEMNTKLDTISKEIEQYIGFGVNHAFCGNMTSYMRKPNPGMAYNLAINLELSLRASVMVGDSETDAKFAKNAYIGTFLSIEDFLKEDKPR